jgi:hypothetical protein
MYSHLVAARGCLAQDYVVRAIYSTNFKFLQLISTSLATGATQVAIGWYRRDKEIIILERKKMAEEKLR